MGISPDLEAGVEALQDGGQPLPEGALRFFEPKFDRNFSNVRVHTDDSATRSAQAMNARAYTVGHHIVFGSGEYAPEGSDGKRLIAHELTHVLQQEASGSRALQRVEGECDCSKEAQAQVEAFDRLQQANQEATTAREVGMVLDASMVGVCGFALMLGSVTAGLGLVACLGAAALAIGSAGFYQYKLTVVREAVQALDNAQKTYDNCRAGCDIPDAPEL